MKVTSRIWGLDAFLEPGMRLFHGEAFAISTPATDLRLVRGQQTFPSAMLVEFGHLGCWSFTAESRTGFGNRRVARHQGVQDFAGCTWCTSMRVIAGLATALIAG